MATINENLKNLTDNDIERISDEYLHGWHDTMKKYGFRVKGFNAERMRRGLAPLTKEMSDQFRINHVKEIYDSDVIRDTIDAFLSSHKASDARYGDGIELFGCRFGPEYARLFKELIGAHEYRQIADKCRVKKLVKTQTDLYGGVGLAGKAAKAKAYATSASSKKEFLIRAAEQLESHGCVLENFRNSSVFEVFVYAALLKRFGADDVLIDYGVHPYDSRYPYPCDFYIKSLDLFIELNMHFTHGGHWFNISYGPDALRKQHLEQTDRVRNRKFLATWCVQDVRKRKAASSANLKYLVFWDGTTKHVGNTLVPNLTDFNTWMYDYDCDVSRFLLDHPKNTY